MEDKKGYAKKQSRPTEKYSFSEEHRPCIKVLNETVLPIKRPFPENDTKKDKFAQHLSSLNEMFDAIQKPTFIDLEEPVKTEEVIENPMQPPLEILRNLAIDLDKAGKFSNSQIKVLEKYGIEWNPDPWKSNQKTASFQRYVRRDKFRYNNRKSHSRFVRKFDEVNIEEIYNNMTKLERPWRLYKGFALKKLTSEVSIKKDMIAQAKVTQNF